MTKWRDGSEQAPEKPESDWTPGKKYALSLWDCENSMNSLTYGVINKNNIKPEDQAKALSCMKFLCGVKSDEEAKKIEYTPGVDFDNCCSKRSSYQMMKGVPGADEPQETLEPSANAKRLLGQDWKRDKRTGEGEKDEEKPPT